ncbi:hypothetical protein F5Y12DRAFT_721129 [Xylaria sp. FL1777]|nr:hypothetical protein F5Y12DRAFT_721129 [Xylaria sp. FL1777]
MAMNPNSGPAEGELEKGVGESLVHDTSSSTRFVRAVIYKIVPFLGFSLVVFSVGAILVSTLSFNKPVPHQGALVVSIILLLFFVLFSIGFIYLQFQKCRPHVSERANPTGRNVQSTTRKFKRPFGNANNAVPRLVEDGLVRSDTLQDQAPSPNTYRRGAEEHNGIDQDRNVLHELGGSTHQRNRHSTQHHGNQTARSDYISPSNPVQGGGLEIDQFPGDRGRNESIQANITSATHDKRARPHPNNQENSLGSRLRGDLVQSSSVVQHHTAGPQNHTGIYIPRRPVMGPRDMPRYSTSRQVPSHTKEVLGPPLSISPDLTGMRSQQLQGLALEQRTSNIVPRKSQAKSDDRQDDVSPWPRPPAKGQKMNKDRDGQATTEGQLAVPIGASVQASLEGAAQNTRNKKRPPYAEYDVTEYMDSLRELPEPKAPEQPRTAEASQLSTGAPGEPHVVNVVAPNNDHKPPAMNQATQKQIHQKGTTAPRRNFSFEIGYGTHQDTIIQSATTPPRSTPTPSRIQGFIARHLSAVPEPLKLAMKSRPRNASDRSNDADVSFARCGAVEMPRPAFFTRPRPPTTPCRPPIYEGEGDDDGGEVSKVSVRGPGSERI